MAASKPHDDVYPLPEQFTPGLIGIVTVTYNSGSVLPDFIRSITQQSYTNFILYAIDNDSKDDTLLQLRNWDEDRLVILANATNVGVAAGNNQGIRAAIEAGCEHVLLLNNDVVFGPELLAQLMDGLAQYNCAMSAPLMYYHDRPDVIWWAGGYFQPLLGYRTLHIADGQKDTGRFRQAHPVTYAPTCCVLIRRAVFGEVGLMDERYFVYSDDVDFMLRAMKAGKVLYYVPHAKLWHKVNSLTGSESPFSMRYGARNRAFFITKHLNHLSVMLFNLLYPSYYLFRFILGKDTQAALRIKQAAWAEGKQMLRR
jgi:GT2 family glycosyltransferase